MKNIDKETNRAYLTTPHEQLGSDAYGGAKPNAFSIKNNFCFDFFVAGFDFAVS
ncbi:hypothetical protein LC653_05615 [Nostoc sp. CHAB 5784]|uniref:hypothetical protein n=1 Tax=Nostoc mirabile TaxID=2907820 RepID=UPI001E599702|nr:hypothetical protein [Nostoc mirabile]MCC5663423.1 hypothetical protein [Nostoc mirabile CHAB5784]